MANKATDTAFAVLLAVLAAVLIAEDLWARGGLPMWVWLPILVAGLVVFVGAGVRVVSNLVPR